jgi:hypothetical protein
MLECAQKLTIPKLIAITAATEAEMPNMHTPTKYGNRMTREFIADVRNPENQYISCIE